MKTAAPGAAKPMHTSPNIQALERKLQVLKRALAIKRGNEEERLEALEKKWRIVGREAAWELWDLVKENVQSNTDWEPKGGRNSFANSWGWDRPEKQNGSNWGWDTSEHQETDEDLSTFSPPSPRKLEHELYKSLRKKPVAERKTLLPPTDRGAYFERQRPGSPPCMTDDHEPQDDECTAQQTTQENTVGTMLLRLGIGHELFGWVPGEGDFADT